MKPASFEYVRCESSAHALEALAQRGADAMVLAGGQSLLPRLYRRSRRAKALLDIARTDDLIGVDVAESSVRVLAATPMSDAERAVRESVPLLARALSHVASPGVRNRGTVGGSAAHADPAAEVPTVLTALEARIKLVSTRGARVVDASALYLGRHATARRADELLTEIELPALRDGERDAWLELAPRHGDLPLVGVGVRLGVREGAIVGGRVALGGACTRPQGFDMPGWAIGERPTGALFELVTSELSAQADFESDDLRSSAGFRRRATEALCRRALMAASAEEPR